jgi:hypothetical protein
MTGFGLLLHASCAVGPGCEDTFTVLGTPDWFWFPLALVGVAIIVFAVVLARRGR